MSVGIGVVVVVELVVLVVEVVVVDVALVPVLAAVLGDAVVEVETNMDLSLLGSTMSAVVFSEVILLLVLVLVLV